MVRPFRRALGAVVGHLRRQLIAGLIIAAPLVATYLILRFIFDNTDALLEPIFTRTLGRDIPGVGFAALVIILYMLGLLATSIIGRAIIRQGEAVLLRIPVLKEIYGPARQTVRAVSQAGQAFRRVVIVEYPGKGVRSIAFATGTFRDLQGRDFIIVYVPTTPIPTNGYIALYPPEEVQDAGISVDDAMRLIISGGLVSAQQAHAAS